MLGDQWQRVKGGIIYGGIDNRYISHQIDYSSLLNDFNAYVHRLKGSIEYVKWKRLYPGSIHASIAFNRPYPSIIDYEVLTLAFIILNDLYAYNIDSVKMTIGYKMQLPSSSELSFTLGKAIPLCDHVGNRLPKRLIYDKIEQLVKLYGEQYQNAQIQGVFIRIYYEKESQKSIDFPNEISDDILTNIRNVMQSDIGSFELPDVKSLKSNDRIPTQIKAIKGERTKCRPFIVADLETIIVNTVHTPYAVGYCEVNPGEGLTSIQTFFSEDYPLINSNFESRSNKILFEFLSKLELTVKKNPSLRTVYFHNLSRFDGIIILRYYTVMGEPYKLKTLMRNHRLYELKVYKNGKLLLRFRDSCILLPGSLKSLGETLCPELGSKGSIKHSELSVSNLMVHREDVIRYLRQDILLLGGVMLKAQKIYWDLYRVDIEDVMTLSSLSLKIFRKKYFDDSEFQIHLPTRNQDTFVRRSYYGGHADVFKPYGENLYYYDVNSLYPFIMKEYPMPCGQPVWKNNLESVELDSLFGFIEACVVCPPNIVRPFLPYKDKAGTLLFPTGKFVGVYYSEELKFARSIGYNIIPLRGYLYEKKESPFKGFVSELYERRQEAKKAGNEAMSYVYKILMNSLYGRFGINPESTVTEICNPERYEELLMKDNFQSAEMLTDHYYIVNYITNNCKTDDTEWKAPKMSAVHLSAAITACARIHMYPYISRDDCYYTDTDSVVLGSQLPDDIISSEKIGMFKLEYQVLRGIFLAPKSYLLDIEEDRHIIKHKGPAKDLVTSEWFQRQLADLSLNEQISTSANFRIDWKELKIIKKDILINLGLPKSTKRENVYDKNNVWIDTRPVEVIDLGSQDATTFYKKLMNDMEESKPEKNIHPSTRQEEEVTTQISQSNTEGEENKPTLYKNNPKDKNKKDKNKKKDHRPKPDE